MFGSMLGDLMNQKAQMDAAIAARRTAELQAMHNQQKADHQAMMDTGAKMIIIKPDGTIVPVYD